MASTTPTLPGIFDHFRRMQEAIALSRTAIVANPGSIGTSSRFAFMTEPELNDAFRGLVSELEVQVNLLLIAAAEARLRLDLLERIGRKLKDPTSRKLQGLEQSRKARAKKGIRLEDVIKAWGSSRLGMSQRASRMGHLLIYRHWVAHDRYFAETKSGLRQPDPFDIWSIIADFFNALPEFDALPDQAR